MDVCPKPGVGHHKLVNTVASGLKGAVLRFQSLYQPTWIRNGIALNEQHVFREVKFMLAHVSAVHCRWGAQFSKTISGVFKTAKMGS